MTEAERQEFFRKRRLHFQEQAKMLQRWKGREAEYRRWVEEMLDDPDNLHETSL